MKNIYGLFYLCFGVMTASGQTFPTFHDYSSIAMNGDTIHLSQYYGKKVMVLNVASFCAYTPQYAPLQQLYENYQQYNFEIIGFPSDDFFNQGGSDSEIVSTCQDYGVTFPITEKVHVSASQFGNSVHPVFQWLEKASLNGVSNATVSWNFHKFLIDEAGHWVRHYDQNIEPDDTAIINWILSPSVISTIPPVNSSEVFDLKVNPVGSCIDCSFRNTALQHYNISIYTNQGQLLQTVFDGFVAEQNLRFPVLTLPSGVYLISVTGESNLRTFRYSVVN